MNPAMKKTPDRRTNVVSKPNAADIEWSMVVTVAALLKNDNHELSSNAAAIQALGLIDECRKELDKRRQPKTDATVPYEEAVRRITGRKDKKRLDRIEQGFRKFVKANPSSVGALSRTDSFYSAVSDAFESGATEEDIDERLNSWKSSGFPDEEIESLKSAYRRWKTTPKSGRRKKS
jgi:hypothetical protein